MAKNQALGGRGIGQQRPAPLRYPIVTVDARRCAISSFAAATGRCKREDGSSHSRRAHRSADPPHVVALRLFRLPSPATSPPCLGVDRPRWRARAPDLPVGDVSAVR